MALPRSWERGDGTVDLFVPDKLDLQALLAGTLDENAYRARFARLIAFRVRYKNVNLLPGALLAGNKPVCAGDTLLCSCAVPKAQQNRCHRTWAAAFLTIAGWAVNLDGTVLTIARAREILMEIKVSTG